MTAIDDNRSLVDRLAATIQARVLSGDLPTGARLRQEAIAAEFGVSRTPVREALRKLEALGVAVLEPNRGAVVRAPTPRDVGEAYELRAELEAFAAARAASLITDEELVRLRDAQRLFHHSITELVNGPTPPGERSWRDSDWERANDQFHQTILDAAGNKRLARVIAELHVAFPRALTWSALSSSSALLRENIGQHDAVLAAISAHDERAAADAMRSHVLAAGELIKRRLERAGDA